MGVIRNFDIKAAVILIEEFLPQRRKGAKKKSLFSFTPLRLCGNKLSRMFKSQDQVQRKKQSYSKCHGAETPDNLKISSTVWIN